MTIEHMRTFLVLVAVVGCSGDDAGPDAIPDSPLPLNCRTYCDQIQASCTGDNAQYPDDAHCMTSCASFPVEGSKVDDTSGHTLGCRIYHAGDPARRDPVAHCAHAGPAGDHLMANPPTACTDGMTICKTFCTLQFRACGSQDAPLPGDPTDMTGNSLYQYRHMEDCLTVCGAFDKTRPYRPTSTGNSLACRLRQAALATLDLESAKATCRFTGMVPQGPCDGVAMP